MSSMGSLIPFYDATELRQAYMEWGHIGGSPEGWFAPSDLYLCRLDMLNLEALYLKNGSSVKFHTGTSENTAKVYMLDGDRAIGGEHRLVQIQLAQPIVAAPMDRFIIRKARNGSCLKRSESRAKRR